MRRRGEEEEEEEGTRGVESDDDVDDVNDVNDVATYRVDGRRDVGGLGARRDGLLHLSR